MFDPKKMAEPSHDSAKDVISVQAWKAVSG
jgi:hypothetical protein